MATFKETDLQHFIGQLHIKFHSLLREQWAVNTMFWITFICVAWNALSGRGKFLAVLVNKIKAFKLCQESPKIIALVSSGAI